MGGGCTKDAHWRRNGLNVGLFVPSAGGKVPHLTSLARGEEVNWDQNENY
jgi:hypothetical protein